MATDDELEQKTELVRQVSENPRISTRQALHHGKLFESDQLESYWDPWNKPG